MAETLLTKIFKQEESKDASDIKLTEEQVKEELNFLKNQTEIDTLLSLMILEKISEDEKNINHNFIETALTCIKESKKYTIYNIRILLLIAKKSKMYVPLSKNIINLIEKLEIKNSEKINVDMNTLKVGGDAALSNFYVEFVIDRLLKLLIYNLNGISNSLGFPEIVSFVIKKLNHCSNLEGKSLQILKDCVEILEDHKDYVIEKREKIPKKLYEMNELKKIEAEIETIKERLDKDNNDEGLFDDKF